MELAIIFSVLFHNFFFITGAAVAISEIITKVSDHFQGGAAAILEITTNVSDHFQGAAAAIPEIITKVSDHIPGAAAVAFAPSWVWWSDTDQSNNFYTYFKLS